MNLRGEFHFRVDAEVAARFGDGDVEETAVADSDGDDDTDGVQIEAIFDSSDFGRA